MATNTYVALQTVTVTGSSTPYIDFTSIPSTYTDLVIQGNMYATSNDVGVYLQFNGDTATNYSSTGLTSGSGGSTAGSFRYSSQTSMNLAGYNFGVGSTNSIYSPINIQIQNYTNTTTYKTVLARSWVQNNAGSRELFAYAGLWRKTPEAITSVRLFFNTGNWAVGTTFSLYGIAAEGTSPAPKAMGGVIYADSSYYYHVFPSSGAFTPSTTLTADVLIVAGGGGGAGSYGGGGGGAGGLRAFASQSLTSGTSYTCTVGSGGTGGLANVNPYGSKGLQGNDTTFNALSVTGGGGGASWGTNPSSGGGSGGGGGAEYLNGGAGNAGGYTPVEGYAGGQGFTTPNYGMAGGGGAGGAAANASSGVSTSGGPGASSYNGIDFSSWLSVTGTGTNGKLAGGGGGSGDVTNSPHITKGYGSDGGGNGGDLTSGENGKASSGSGGGAGGYPAGLIGGNGGSGLIIVRYAK